MNTSGGREGPARQRLQLKGQVRGWGAGAGGEGQDGGGCWVVVLVLVVKAASGGVQTLVMCVICELWKESTRDTMVL